MAVDGSVPLPRITPSQIWRSLWTPAGLEPAACLTMSSSLAPAFVASKRPANIAIDSGEPRGRNDGSNRAEKTNCNQSLSMVTTGQVVPNAVPRR